MNHSSTAEAPDTDKLVSIHGDNKVVVATQEHIECIYPFMRKHDRLEVACMGHTPKEALEYGLKNDDITFTAKDGDDVPYAMFGSGSLNEQSGYIWLLATDAIEDNAYPFIKASRKYVQIIAKPYGSVMNFVHADNKKAIQWLRHCKAIFLRKVTISSQPFIEFIIISNHV